MASLDEQMKNLFKGDKELAVCILNEIQTVKQSIEKIDTLLQKDLCLDDRKKMAKALITSYAEIAAEIQLPIFYKYPELRSKSAD